MSNKTRSKTAKEYVNDSFKDVADIYDEIAFFKTSANYLIEVAKRHNIAVNSKSSNILDVACGTGNVAIELAKTYPHCHITGVDISNSMLAKAKQKAQVLALDNTTFINQDVTTFETTQRFELISVAYAMFFLPNAPEVLAKLQSLLTVNGKLIFTSFQAQAFKPASNILLALLRKYHCASTIKFNENHSSNLLNFADIEALCKQAKVNIEEITTRSICYELSIDDWWQLFNNTGYKGMLMELSYQDYQNLEHDFMQQMRQQSIYQPQSDSLELNADSFYVVVH